MDHPDAPDVWRKGFVATLRLIGSVAARLPYGVPEPVLGSRAAIELYSGGLWPAQQVELLTTEVHRLQVELVATGFRQDEHASSDAYNLWHPALDRGISISVRPPFDANVVAVELGSAGRQDAATIRVIGIEDLIADQITGWLRDGGQKSAITTLVQILIELGRTGVAGPLRAAYLQRRLARETGGEAVLEMPLGLYGLDDPAPRMTSLTSIDCLVRNWRASRNLTTEAAEIFGSAYRTSQGSSGLRARNEMKKSGGLSLMKAQIIPFRPYDQ